MEVEVEVWYVVGAAPAQSEAVQMGKGKSLGGFVSVSCFTSQL